MGDGEERVGRGGLIGDAEAGRSWGRALTAVAAAAEGTSPCGRGSRWLGRGGGGRVGEPGEAIPGRRREVGESGEGCPGRGRTGDGGMDEGETFWEADGVAGEEGFLRLLGSADMVMDDSIADGKECLNEGKQEGAERRKREGKEGRKRWQ